MNITVTEVFRRASGALESAVVEFDGVPLLVSPRSDHVRLSIWGPAQGMAEENPGWAKLKELEDRGLVAYTYVGMSIAHDDHYRWLGEPLTGPDAA